MATYQTVSTMLNANGANVVLPAGEAGVIAVDVRGTFVGTLQFEGTVNGTDYFAVPFVVPTTAAQAAAVTSTTAVGVWISGAAGILAFRVRFSAYTSGAAIVTIRGEERGLPYVFPTGAAALAVTLASTTLAPSATVGGFTTFFHLISAATTNATSVKASAGTIGTITLSNTSAAVKYFKLYNKASAPTVGTDIPILTLLVPAGQTVIFSPQQGIRLATGIAIALTGGVTVADTAAVALNDLAVHIDYT